MELITSFLIVVVSVALAMFIAYRLAQKPNCECGEFWTCKPCKDRKINEIVEHLKDK